MSENTDLTLLQVSTEDILGGAEKIALDLHYAYRKQGYESWLAVGQKVSDSTNIFQLNNDKLRNYWARFWLKQSTPLYHFGKLLKDNGRIRNVTYAIGQYSRWSSIRKGMEDFDYPASWNLLKLPPNPPDILHFHNLHGGYFKGYFDLRALPWLCQQRPTVLTLHDSWLLSGHCAHSFNCERWKTGCGNCPDLSIYPAFNRDSTAFNWKRKQEIFAGSRFFLVTPSKWLMDRVAHSIVNPAVIESRIIPNGVDLSIFHPEKKQLVRSKLNIPIDSRVLLFAAYGIKKNPWKDYQMMKDAVLLLSKTSTKQKILFIALGEDSTEEKIGNTDIRFVPFQKEPERVAEYYQASDIYLHAAKADTFPTTILEALACGTPVIGTSVGGIPEQIEDGKTGYLVSPGNASEMATKIQNLLDNETLYDKMCQNAADSAKTRFSLERMSKDYLDLYRVMLSKK